MKVFGFATSLVTCRRKVRYAHKESALKACTEMAAKGVEGLSPYRCGICLGWHIGHQRPGPRITVEEARNG